MTSTGSDVVGRTLLIAQAAELMGVSRRTVYYRIREGRLASVKTRCGSRRVIVPSVEWLRRQGMRKNAARAAVRSESEA